MRPRPVGPAPPPSSDHWFVPKTAPSCCSVHQAPAHRSIFALSVPLPGALCPQRPGLAPSLPLGRQRYSPPEAFSEHLIYTAGWLATTPAACGNQNMLIRSPWPLSQSNHRTLGCGVGESPETAWTPGLVTWPCSPQSPYCSTTVTGAPIRIAYGPVSSMLLIEYGSFRGGAASVSFTQ